MPVPDPMPSPAASTKRRFLRILRLLAALATVIAAMAVLLVSSGDPTVHIHMMIATALGVFITVLVGTGLMTLAFISNSSGHDDEVASFREENDEE